jgi:hypothetical protein
VGNDAPGIDAVRALGHALRNALSPAMMVAERLSEHADPAVRRGAKVILESLDKATEATRQAVSNSAEQ